VRQGLKNSSKGGKGQKYLFSGLLKCGQCEGNYVVTSRYQYGCGTRINRGTVVCDNGIRVSRELLERTLLARIKEDLLCEEGIELFLKETQRLLQQTPNPTQDLGKQLLLIEKEIQNVLKAIKAGILTESTEAELRPVGSQEKGARIAPPRKKRGVFERSTVYPGVAGMLSESRQQFRERRGRLLIAYSGANKKLGWQPDKTPSDRPEGHLEAELAGDYAEFLKLTGEKSKIMVVAGTRFVIILLRPSEFP